ncbi:MAG: multicomponent Na+:H+ antiporter subunit G [Spirochaetes bacterium]|nr:MAG: multicomponent Na+:H+ antiporter subunit G [Spirochaetota bacterium]
MTQIIETARIGLALFCFAASLVFGVTGIVGLNRYKSPLPRLQASSLCGTTAVFSIILGCLAIAPTWAFFFRLLAIGGFFLVSNPLGTHFIATYARKKKLTENPRGLDD